jgi:hypothetical protein
VPYLKNVQGRHRCIDIKRSDTMCIKLGLLLKIAQIIKRIEKSEIRNEIVGSDGVVLTCGEVVTREDDTLSLQFVFFLQ